MLENPVWASLVHGPHARLAERTGAAARYVAEASPFHALADLSDEESWADLAALAGAGAEVLVTGPVITPPAGWTVVERIDGVQMSDTGGLTAAVSRAS
ncbi:hypothetical protein ACIA8K_36830 [Catenuloplanes sp. NPDC051500]|uniref:hypothetical protein n=1 Tax=Catenuloplanes sp. NPDC051500 TaxID=3363959 RepID=UPI0037B946EC